MRKKPRDKRVAVHIGLTPEQMEIIERMRPAFGRSRSEVLQFLISIAFDRLVAEGDETVRKARGLPPRNADPDGFLGLGPVLTTALRELALTGFYGFGTHLEVVRELAREGVLKLVKKRSDLIPRTLEAIGLRHGAKK